MGTVIQLPVGNARRSALKRLAAANEPEKAQPATQKSLPWKALGRKLVGAASVTAVLSTRAVGYGAGMAAGLLATMLWIVCRPAQALAGLLIFASLSVIGIQWHTGWADPKLATQCAMIACGATLILFLLQLSIRFLFSVERRLKGTC